MGRQSECCFPRADTVDVDCFPGDGDIGGEWNFAVFFVGGPLGFLAGGTKFAVFSELRFHAWEVEEG